MAKPTPLIVHNEQEEALQVKKDLLFVLGLNGLFLAAILVLFFVNRSSGIVDNFFAKILKF